MYRILNINHNKELLWSLGVVPNSRCSIASALPGVTDVDAPRLSSRFP